MNYEKIVPLFLVLTNYILLTKSLPNLNLTSFQPGLDWIPDIKFSSSKPKKRGYRLITSVYIEFTRVEQI